MAESLTRRGKTVWATGGTDLPFEETMTRLAGRFNTAAGRLGYLLDLGACMLQAGLARKESRGAHSRPSDFPERDDEQFLKHSITEWVDGGPKLSYRDVRMTRWEPMVRSY
jgi:succinate dehydrogenase/fumarate reductase flavoprotein subunit